MSGDLIALPVALVVIAYHYAATRDVRRTLRRMADALEGGPPDHQDHEQDEQRDAADDER